MCCRATVVPATQLPIETTAAYAFKSACTIDLQTDIIFTGNGEPKISKFTENIESIVIVHNIGI